ncbi:MAG: hypothetical protein A3K18_11135 [Lentisphaerae bacterium RIFOXYA12_64_32]|nr:MAG: hypothetical protein A3K18_11135 [Lentisphaerae bacterium RIFOXYA12_64_32]
MRLARESASQAWEKYLTAQRQFQGIPGLERTPDGRLWATWYTGGVGEGPENFAVLVTSDDDGLSWTEPLAVVDPPGNTRAFDPCLWRDPKGRFWWLWSESYSPKVGEIFDGRGGVWGAYATDLGPATLRFTAPVRLANGVMMNKPTVLANGDWLLPTAVWQQWPIKLEELAVERFSNATVSTDGGTSFTRRGGADVPERGFDEHMFVELHDGRVWCLVRTCYGIGQSFSVDAGRTWTPGEDSSLGGPNSRFFIRRLRSGNLLLVNHIDINAATARQVSGGGQHWRKRSHLAALLSPDDGRTWKGPLMLDERGDVSYPDGVQAEDGTIWIIYDYNRYGAGDIVLASFREDDILAGACQSKGAFLRRLVSHTGGLRGKPTNP